MISSKILSLITFPKTLNEVTLTGSEDEAMDISLAGVHHSTLYSEVSSFF